MALKIISAGGSGIDGMAREVALELGLQTGGAFLSPKDIARGENVAEVHVKQVRQNIMDADATLLYYDPESLAFKTTVEYCLLANKPYLLNPNAEDLSAFIRDNHVQYLNVIGTRGSRLIPEFLDAYRTSFRRALLPFSEQNS